MATPHIGCEPGDIAELVLMPGDPLRAKRIAETFLTDARCVSEVRGNGVYTGTYQGTPMSVMASGMGIPTMSLYATELFRFYGVRRICRVGTCGGMQADVAVRDVVIANCAHTNSGIATLRVPGMSLSLAASFDMLRAAVDEAKKGVGARVHVGPVFSSDYFYMQQPGVFDGLTAIGTLAVEMESAGLYGTAAAEHAEALTVLTVSDNLLDGSGDMSPEERETAYQGALRIAAAALLA